MPDIRPVDRASTARPAQPLAPAVAPAGSPAQPAPASPAAQDAFGTARAGGAASSTGDAVRDQAVAIRNRRSARSGPDPATLTPIGRVLNRALADRILQPDEVDALFKAAGAKVSPNEVQELRAALFNAGSQGLGAYTVTDAARERGLQLAVGLNLPKAERAEVVSGTSFGGTAVPPAVRELLGKARLAGALAYDVNEMRTNKDGEEVGVWSPYPATTPATGNMAFDYTEITPGKLAADKADRNVRYNVMAGTEKKKDPESGDEYEAVVYRPGQGGTGNILATYDEAWHDDLYSRGSEGQKWANNFAILSDGSIHCLPAARRSQEQDLILTNPHLSRGKSMLFNGHLDVRDGVVVGVEMSGRLSKAAAEGEASFVDPIPFLKAWGFTIDPNVRLQYGNTARGTPVEDPESGTIRAAQT